VPEETKGARERMKKEEAKARINEIGIVPCVRATAAEQAHFAAETLYAASLPIIEIPLTVPGALEAIANLAKRHSDLVVGAGTVLDEDEAQRSIESGARFLTAPGFVPEVVACARNANVLVFPGAMTPSEVIAAWKAGSDFVKIYPAVTAGGKDYIRALKTPLPQIPLIVTGGVNQLTAFDYIRAGASAIGVGSELLPKEALAHHQDYWIRELAERFRNKVRAARAQRDAM